jgi:hypothetical protein
VLPVSTWDGKDTQSVALGLRVTDGIALADRISQPAAHHVPSIIQRSLVIGNVLWTLSESGLQASDLSTLDRLSWLPSAS